MRLQKSKPYANAARHDRARRWCNPASAPRAPRRDETFRGNPRVKLVQPHSEV